MPPTLILASASPRRSDLLREHRFDFSVVPARIEEVSPPFLTVGEIVLLNARRKAGEVASRFPNEVILAADTLVALGGEVFGKPADMQGAAKMLQTLSGKTHQVYSGVWVQQGDVARAANEISHVTFRTLGSADIARYFEHVNPLDKAGAYAAQEKGSDVIEEVRGSFTNVVGLPMEQVVRMLREFGL